MLRPSQTDQEILARVQQGEAEALGELYDRLSPLLFAVVKRVLRSRGEAEDALQETWVQVWDRAASYSPERGSVQAWLVTIARSRALDRVRRLRVRADAEAVHRERAKGPELEGAGESRKDPVESEERSRIVHGALEKLKVEYRQVLEVAFFEGLTQSEISRRLEIPLGTVKTWMRRGLEALRTSLSDLGSISNV